MNISDLTKEDYLFCYNLMSPERKAHVDRLRIHEDKLRTVCGELLARLMIAGKLNISAEDIMFDRTDRGKPFAVGLPVEFSLSHSFQLVLCALSDRPVGADIEMTRRISQKLVNYVCTDRELHYLSSAAESDVYNRRFLEVWTAKEAYFKRLGTGITSLKDICVLDDLFRRDLTFFREGDYTVSILSELPCVRVESPFVLSEGGND